MIRHLSAAFLFCLSVVLGTVACSNDSSSSKPSAPITFTKNTVFTQVTNGNTNYVYVPDSYDSTHNTPTELFVWLHGCGGYAANDASMVSYMPNQKWISLAIGGREGGCWSYDPKVDGPKVLQAMTDIKTHFNIDPRHVILGGYSSGGDLGYPLLMENAQLFAGALFENTGPDAQALSDAKTAAWKVNITHLAHLQDNTYPIGPERDQMAQLKALGFPVTQIEKAGGHWDNDNGAYGTTYDLRTFLLPLLQTNTWQAPGAAPVDAGASPDTSTPVVDAAPMTDSSVADSSVTDAGVKDATTVDSSTPVDASTPVKDAGIADGAVPKDSGAVDAGPKVWTLYAKVQVFERTDDHVCVFFLVNNTTAKSVLWTSLALQSNGGKVRNTWYVQTQQTSGTMYFTPKTPERQTIGGKATVNVGGVCLNGPRSMADPVITGINQP